MKCNGSIVLSWYRALQDVEILIIFINDFGTVKGFRLAQQSHYPITGEYKSNRKTLSAFALKFLSTNSIQSQINLEKSVCKSCH